MLVRRARADLNHHDLTSLAWAFAAADVCNMPFIDAIARAIADPNLERNAPLLDRQLAQLHKYQQWVAGELKLSDTHQLPRPMRRRAAEAAEARERALADAALAHGVAQPEVRRPVPDAALAGATPWASRSGTLLQPDVRRDPEEINF